MKTPNLRSKLALLSIIVATLTGSYCCGSKTTEEEAKDAAIFMCDCTGGSLEQSKGDSCLEVMKKKFDHWGTDKFVDTFNAENDCGLELQLQRTPTTHNASENSSSLHVVSARKKED
jgi:hypothetical protein